MNEEKILTEEDIKREIEEIKVIMFDKGLERLRAALRETVLSLFGLTPPTTDELKKLKTMPKNVAINISYIRFLWTIAIIPLVGDIVEIEEKAWNKAEQLFQQAYITYMTEFLTDMLQRLENKTERP